MRLAQRRRSAAAEIAPFAERPLCVGRAHGEGNVIVGKRVWQAGARTAQALSALTCGLGTLPYALAIGRDLGPLPLRCLPDVLTDSGFDASFYYGARPSFDNMETFIRLHGFSRVVGQWQLPRSLPIASWGVSDLALFDAVIAEANDFDDRPRYAIVMSVTNHMPFVAPADLPSAVADRVDAALARVPNSAGKDDQARLRTYSYTDYAVGHFIDGIEHSALSDPRGYSCSSAIAQQPGTAGAQTAPPQYQLNSRHGGAALHSLRDHDPRGGHRSHAVSGADAHGDSCCERRARRCPSRRTTCRRWCSHSSRGARSWRGSRGVFAGIPSAATRRAPGSPRVKPDDAALHRQHE